MLKPIFIVKVILFLGVIWGLILGLNTVKEINWGLLSLKIPTLESIVPQQKFTVNSWPLNTTKKIADKKFTPTGENFEIDSTEIDWIQHPPYTQNILFNFYKKIKLEKSKDIIRILHFGDSQIEGDRISSVLREELQKKWGGSGTGFLPLSENNFGKPSAQIEINNWQKYQWFNSQQNTPYRNFGFLGYFHQLLNPQKPGVFNVKTSAFTATKNIPFNWVKILYSTLSTNANCIVEQNTHKIQSPLISSVKAQLLSVPLQSNLNQKIDFTINNASQNINFLGISFDSDTGITVDNIPMRGSSIIQLSKGNYDFLKTQFELLNVGLIIYQFGINVVPNILSNYDYYEKMMRNELHLLKKLVPNASILVVGISDMSYFNNAEYQSYPNLSIIKQAQKNAAFANNCAFWDLQEVMGGNNSMVTWVNAQPPLAQPDHAHFSPSGAKIIGQKLAQAILQDFEDYVSFLEPNLD